MESSIKKRQDIHLNTNNIIDNNISTYEATYT